MVMELKYTDLEERFRTRVLYAATPEEAAAARAELDSACGVRSTWRTLMDEADMVDWSLQDTKEHFSETTREQVSEFQVSSRRRCGQRLPRGA